MLAATDDYSVTSFVRRCFVADKLNYDLLYLISMYVLRSSTVDVFLHWPRLQCIALALDAL